jgi:hypothetical protein
LSAAFDPNSNAEELDAKLKVISIAVFGIGIATWGFGYIGHAFWQHVGEQIHVDLRLRYLKSLL